MEKIRRFHNRIGPMLFWTIFVTSPITIIGVVLIALKS